MKNLLQAGAQEEIRRRVQALTPADARLWGVLSVEEMMAHVRHAYFLTTTDANPPVIKNPLPPGMIKFLALSMPAKWPKGVPTTPRLKREALPPADSFAVEKERLLAEYARFLTCSNNTARHPMFGPMKPADWMRWGYLHADHHLRQFGR